MSFLPIRTVPLISSQTITRTSPTTAYVAGQIVGDVGGAAMNFSSIIQAANLDGFSSDGGLLIKSSTQLSNATFRLYLFNADPGSTVDYATYAPTFANRGRRVGFIDYVYGVAGADNAEFNGNLSRSNMTFSLGGATGLYGQLVATSPYVPVAGEQFYVQIASLS